MLLAEMPPVEQMSSGPERCKLVECLNGLVCRGIIEHNISEVARGARRKEDVLDEAVQHFRGDYMAAAQKQGCQHASCNSFDTD